MSVVRLLVLLQVLSLLLAITNKRTKLARIAVLVEFDEETFVELKSAWKLLRYLPNALEELRKDGRHFLGNGLVLEHVAQTMRELVAEHEPILLDEHLETVNGPVVRVEEESGQSAHLRGPIPTVRAVDDDADVLGTDGLGYED